MRGFTFTFGFFLAILPACTKPPSVPDLPQREPLTVEKIILSDKIAPKDIRDLFRAVNADGALDALKPYFEEASDDELSDIGKLITRYLYRDPREPGLLELLDRRIEKKSFTSWAKSAEELSKEPTYAEEGNVFRAALANPKIVPLLPRDVYLLNPKLLSALHEARRRVSDDYREIKLEKADPLPRAEAVEAAEWVSAAETFLSDKPTRAALIKSGELFQKHYAGQSVLRSLNALLPRGSRPFDGFALGLWRMLVSPPEALEEPLPYLSQLDLFLHFADLANSPAKQLLEALQTQIHRESRITTIISQKMRFGISSMVDLLKIRLSDAKFDRTFWAQVNSEAAGGPSPQFNQLFSEIVSTFDQFIYPYQIDRRTQVALYLNSFAIAKWLEKNAKPVLAGLPDPENKPAKFWSLVIPTKKTKIEFAKKDAGGALIFPYSAQMTESRLKDFPKDLEAWVKSNVDPLENFTYQLTVSLGETTLGNALETVADECNFRQPMLNEEGVFRALIVKITRPGESSFFSTADLETDNIFDFLNRLIKSLSVREYRLLKQFVFADLQVGRNPAVTEAILDLFNPPELLYLKPRMKDLLDSVQSVAELDHIMEEGVPTPFETYWSLLNFTHPPDLPWLSHFVATLAKGRFFSLTAKAGEKPVPVYPAVYKKVASHDMGRFLFGVGSLPEAVWPTVLEAGTNVLGRTSDAQASGLAQHLDLFEDLILPYRRGILAFFSRVQRRGWELLPTTDDISSDEWEWLRYFLANEGHGVLWNFFKSHGSVESVLRFTRELKALLERGKLARAFNLLGLVRNDRIQEISRHLLRWEQSGELRALFNLVETSLSPLAAKP